MIEYVRGELAELSPATAVIDCNGVGYAANISLNTYSAIQGKKNCKLYIYEAIREDAYVLYGFADQAGAGDFPAAHFRVPGTEAIRHV